MANDSNCIFCKIVFGELPSIQVYENENVIAFMDINPVATGHVLVVPKEHWKDIYEIPDEQLGHVAAAAKKVATAVKNAFNPDGISVTQANGKGAAQSVGHYHVHIVPRTMGDELKINWKLVSGDMEEVALSADQIKSQLN